LDVAGHLGKQVDGRALCFGELTTPGSGRGIRLDREVREALKNLLGHAGLCGGRQILRHVELSERLRRGVREQRRQLRGLCESREDLVAARREVVHEGARVAIGDVERVEDGVDIHASV
jgi:hypothetical protein